ncbi:MAG: nucleoside triphosphate pyrophosphohydrolase [Chloroflexi bacterium]|jgi:tetrapyrrole methylase family protein / MazG family protein|nr:nucleoside triphosphate pyrophosphohydrolase [Chloroflexota bacterium]MBT7080373.1 nucleoside triphosphate pyrophosphohydrolase [Chloroflexota bacterium]MBT7289811.1 nucleoside triphosphate pyrophosphohydrolase [Chloroflexota bacterium]
MQENLSDFYNLVNIIAKLRAPDGCPWDREQTHSSIKQYLIEEAYEVIQTIDENKVDKLCEELGDLLLQILLHTEMAKEAGEFDIGDVIRRISEKMIRRHPHVFGDAKADSPDEVVANWDEIKKQENNGETSLLNSVPKNIPALAYSYAIQNRAARTGFDWKNFDGILDKVMEEIGELKDAKTQPEKVHEFGDLMFVLTNVARWLNIDPEMALKQANGRFFNRFSYMEKVCQQKSVLMNELTFDQQNQLWEEAKKKEQEGKI